MEMEFKTELDNLDISERLSNICKRAKIKTLDELFKLDYAALNNLRGLGKKTIQEINDLRVRFGEIPLDYPYEITYSENRQHRNNIKYSFDQLNTLDYRQLINVDVSEINLSNRLVNVLERLEIYTIKDVIKSNITPLNFSILRNVGVKTAKEYGLLYNTLKSNASEKIQQFKGKIEKANLLLNRELSDITISFPIYKALSELGVNKLKDIIKLNITPKTLHESYGLKGNQIEKFDRLYNNLEKEHSQLDSSLLVLFSEPTICFDISKIPESFYDKCVDFFMLPIVVDRFLENNQIKTFNELASKEESQLIGLTPYVKQILDNLIQTISEKNFYEQFVPRDPYYFPFWIDNFVNGLKHRESEIFKLRYACYGEIYTLEQIGQKFSLTRERVRQIVHNLRKTFQKKFSQGLKNLEKTFKEEIVNNFSPLTQNELFEKIDEKPKFPPRFYLIVLQDIFSHLPIKVDGIQLRQKFLSREKGIEHKIVKLLKERLPVSISKEKFELLVGEESELDFFSFVRVALISPRIKIQTDNSKIKIELKRSTFDNAVRAIFNSLDRPVTIAEFINKLRFHFPNLRNISNEDYVRIRLVNHPKVYRLDTNVFANYRLLKEICSNENEIIEFCHNELEKRNIPTAIYDLVPLVKFADIRFHPQNPNYLLDALISTDKRFIKLDRLLYGLGKWGKVKLSTVADLAYESLKTNKAPMHFATIYDLIRQKRSVLEITVSTSLRIDDRIQSYPPGWYGLIDSHHDNLIYLLLHSPYLDSLIYSLKPGTSLEDMVDLLDMQDHVDSNDVEQVLARDPRFIIYTHDQKKRVYHKNWPLRKLIADILGNSNDGLDLQELQWRLNDLYGIVKNFSTKEIKTALSAMINIVRVNNRYVLSKEMKVSDNLKEKIISFAEKNMRDKNILYDLEEMFDSFKDAAEIDEEEITIHHFRICFNDHCKENFMQIGTDIYRRVR